MLKIVRECRESLNFIPTTLCREEEETTEGWRYIRCTIFECNAQWTKIATSRVTESKQE